MCPFKGRSRFHVFMKDKPTKWGFKFCGCCQSGSGYVYRLEMFCGDKRVSNKPRDVVMHLVERLLRKGYHLYLDNCYCKPGICIELADQGTMVYGTLCKNQVEMPHDRPNDPLVRGEVVYRRQSQVVACRWLNKREVYTMSTMHKPDLQQAQGQF